MFTFVRLLCLSLALVPCAAHARDIFVDNIGGDDRQNGGAAQSGREAGPCRTIAKALRLAVQADRIVLANHGVPYEESITLEGPHHSGGPTRAFALVGNGAVLSGARPVPRDGWLHVQGDVFAFLPPRASFQQLFMNDLPVERVFAKEAGQAPPLKPRQWALFERQMMFRVEKDRLPQYYKMTYAAEPVGITLYNVDNVIISDLTVEGFQLDGINAHDTARRVSLAGITSRGNGRSGVNVGGASRVSLTGCLVGNNGVAQVRTEGHCEVYLGENELLENPAPAVLNEGGRVLRKEAAATAP